MCQAHLPQKGYSKPDSAYKHNNVCTAIRRLQQPKRPQNLSNEKTHKITLTPILEQAENIMSTQIVRQISCFDYGIISLQGTGLHNKTLLTERIRL